MGAQASIFIQLLQMYRTAEMKTRSSKMGMYLEIVEAIYIYKMPNRNYRIKIKDPKLTQIRQKMPRGTTATTEERRNIMVLRQEGKSLQNKAERLGRSKKVVFTYLKFPEMYAKKPRHGRKGISSPTTERRVGLSAWKWF